MAQLAYKTTQIVHKNKAWYIHESNFDASASFKMASSPPSAAICSWRKFMKMDRKHFLPGKFKSIITYEITDS